MYIFHSKPWDEVMDIFISNLRPSLRVVTSAIRTPRQNLDVGSSQRDLCQKSSWIWCLFKLLKYGGFLKNKWASYHPVVMDDQFT